jgi:hypothetical protein
VLLGRRACSGASSGRNGSERQVWVESRLCHRYSSPHAVPSGSSTHFHCVVGDRWFWDFLVGGGYHWLDYGQASNRDAELRSNPDFRRISLPRGRA